MSVSYSRAKRIRLSRLVNPHVPFNEPANLTLSVAAREHPLDEFVVLGLGLAVLLRFEGNDGEKVLDLGEHPLLDDVADLLVRRPRRVLAIVLRAITKRELHDLVAEVL